MFEVYDFDGILVPEETAAAWLAENFGADLKVVQGSDKARYRVTRVQAQLVPQVWDKGKKKWVDDYPVPVRVTVLGANGKPKAGVKVKLVLSNDTIATVPTSDLGGADFLFTEDMRYSLVGGKGNHGIGITQKHDGLTGMGCAIIQGGADRYIGLITFQWGEGETEPEPPAPPEPPEPPVPLEGVTFLDAHGYVISQAQFEAIYGPTDLSTPDGCIWFVEYLKQNITESTEVAISFRDEEGLPIVNMQMVWGFADPSKPLPNGDMGEVWPTDYAGAIRVTMGPGGFYGPGVTTPPHWVYPLHEPGQKLRLGWFDRHFHFDAGYRRRA